MSLWLNWVPLESSCLVRIVQFSQTSRSFVYPFTPAFLFFLSFFFLFFPPNFFPFLISRYLTFRFVFSKPTKVESIAWCLITLFAAQNVRFGFVCRRASACLSFFSSVRDVLYCSNPLRMKAFAVADCSNLCWSIHRE